jgi:YVTN family beta-propeller protein
MLYKNIGKVLSIVSFFLICLFVPALYADWVIDSISTGDSPQAICVNPKTNKIYVVNSNSNNVTVIDGETNLTTYVTAGDEPWAICANPNTNKIYVSNWSSYNVTVIDGATNSTTSVGVEDGPCAVCVNPNTNKIYVPNYNSNDVTVIDEVVIYPSPLASSINPLSNNETTNRIPLFTGSSVNSRSPNNSNIMKVLYQFETTQGAWEEATITSGGGTSSVS